MASKRDGAATTAARGVLGSPTRGTTAARRLRHVDRWLAREAEPALRTSPDPLVVDLGFGERPVTTWELAGRLRGVRPDVAVVGLDVDPHRVAAARAGAQAGGTAAGAAGPAAGAAGPAAGAAGPAAGAGGAVLFLHGGFEIPPAHRRPVVIRAMNVLRQYPVAQVGDAWATMAARLAPGGLLVEGTSDEDGRRAAWVHLDASGAPRQLVLATTLSRLGDPAELAARLPRALIHRNVPGEGVHAFLAELSAAWAREAARGVFGPPQRFAAAVARVRAAGWPVAGGPRRWSRGEVAVGWEAVRPRRPAPPQGGVTIGR